MQDIEITRELNQTDQASLWGWGHDIFGTAALGLEWRPKELHLIARDEARAISKVSLLTQEVMVNGAAIRVGGVGGVVTVPDHQRRGLASSLMARAALIIRDELECDFGFLFCLPDKVGFYRSLGWEAVRSAVNVEQAAGTLVMPLPAMTLALSARAWPEGHVVLSSKPW